MVGPFANHGTLEHHSELFTDKSVSNFITTSPHGTVQGTDLASVKRLSQLKKSESRTSGPHFLSPLTLCSWQQMHADFELHYITSENYMCWD